MSDPKPLYDPNDDPFAEFPSEQDTVSGLTRRLRGDEADEAAPPEEPSVDWSTGPSSSFTESEEPAESDPEPVVRPVSRSELLLTPRPRLLPGSQPEADTEPEPAWHDPDEPHAAHVEDLTDHVRARTLARTASDPRALVVTAVVVAGLSVVGLGYVWLNSDTPVADPASPPDEIATSNATITSRPAGATVVIDGVERGETPLTLSLPVGEHGLELQRGETQASLPLSMERDTAMSAHVELPEPVPVQPAPPAVPPVGWLSIDIPVELNVEENGVIVGTTADARLALAPGRHRLELASEALEFRAVVDVTIGAGRTSTAAVTLPNGSVSISAWPWARVSVDGLPVGVTPLGDLSLPIGEHEVVWTHPQYGERRRVVTVTAQTPVRIGVDFTQ